MSYQLNPHQRDAVSHIHGPLLVLAGAGSGKTSVITQKISHLIRHCNYQPKHIAAITFTNKAAKEMAERVNEMLKDCPSKGLIVATFHNLGLRFISQEIKHLPLRSNFSIFDGADSLSLIKELSPVEIACDKSLLQGIQHGISNWKSDLISPDRAIALAKGQDQLIAAKLYQKYQRHLHAYNALDFDDLIRVPVELLQTNEEVRERWRNKIRYLLVDEYQDTNTCQYQFVKLLSGPRAHFTVVGDDDQSIYAWRGANPENLAILQKDYPALEVIKLEQNYRSSGRILKAANSLIDNNPHMFVKKLWSDHAYGEPIRVLALNNEEQEAERIAAEIITGHFNEKISYSDYAVLYRGNHQAKLIERAMISNNIPYRVSGGTSFFARTEIKDVMAYLRLISNQDDDNAFLRIVNVPRREIGASTLEKLGTTASDENCSLFVATGLSDMEKQLSARRCKIMQRFVGLIETAGMALEAQNLEAELTKWFISIGYKDWLLETSSNEKVAGYRWQNVEELLRWIGNMEISNEGQNQDLSTIICKLMLRDRLDQQQ